MNTNSNLSAEADFAVVTSALRQWSSRQRLVDGLVWVPRGLLAGLLAAALVASLARTRPLLSSDQLAIVVLALAGAGLSLGLLVLALRNKTPEQTARRADRLLQLQERLSTAVQLHGGSITTSATLARLQLEDTVAAVENLDVRSALPLRIRWVDWILIISAIALLSLAVLLPNPQSEALKRRQSIARSIESQVSVLEALEEEVLSNPTLTEDQKSAIREPLERALESLGSGDLSQEGAVATLSEAESELRALADQFGAPDLSEALKSAGQPLAEDAVGSNLGGSLQSGDLSQAGAAAASLADALPELTADERAALAEALGETAAALQSTDERLSQQLAEAAESLRQGNVTAAQRALREASGTLQDRAQEAAAAVQAESAAGRVAQGRQEVAQAGTAGGAGQQEQGEAVGQGEGQGAGQGPNAGQGQGQNGGPGQGAQIEQGEGAGGPGPGGGHTENVFVPDFVDLSGQPGIDIELPAQCRENPAECGSLLGESPTEFGQQGSSVPYSEVFGDYRDAAYEALTEDYIPLGLKDYVREYFSSLEP